HSIQVCELKYISMLLCGLHFLLICSIQRFHFYCFFFFTDTATTGIYTLSLHDALPIWPPLRRNVRTARTRDLSDRTASCGWTARSEEHTSELQSRENLVCRLLLEKKKINNHNQHRSKHTNYKHSDYPP